SEIKGVLFREDGEPSEGLKGEKEFQEVKVPGQDEKYDSRFSGDQVSLQKGEGGSDYRVELKDLELAKPETVQGRVRQPIPLEYKDLLE
ncbi:MAG: hypothetical protein GX589_03460, partial [Deltaproteobacteria bacterium]|nr:hypothetical protein [Deltaproteobacteria bacterium]